MDLVKILKDCPKGVELYSPVYGTVKFCHVDEDDAMYSICVILANDSMESFTREGYLYHGDEFLNVECVLFPSKDNRDWSTFKAPIEKFNILALKPFEQVIGRDSNDEEWKCDFFNNYDINKSTYKFRCISSFYVQCVPYNEETKHLIGTTDMPPKKYINW